METSITIRASASAIGFAAASMVPLWFIAAYVATDRAYIWGSFLIILFTAYIIVSVASTAILIEDRILKFQRYFSDRWIINLDEVTAEIGVGGDLDNLPAIVFVSKNNNIVTKRIVTTQFRKKDVEILKNALLL